MSKQLGINVEVTGADEMIRSLQKISGQVRGQIAKNAVDEGAAVIQFHAQLNARNVFSDRQRGQLRNSIRSESKTVNDGAEAEIGPHVIYGRIQEYGGTIRPIHAQVLHWVLDGQDYFAKSVTLPPRPYLRPAVEDHIQQISDVMKSTVEDGIRDAI